MLAIFGVVDVVAGPAADRAIPLGLTGMTIEEIQAEGSAGYAMFDFFTRANGLSLLALGALLSAILIWPFRRGERWAWWTAWLLPAWAAAVGAMYLVVGVQPDRPPPPPMVSGPVIAVLSTAVLLVSAPRFFRSRG